MGRLKPTFDPATRLLLVGLFFSGFTSSYFFNPRFKTQPQQAANPKGEDQRAKSAIVFVRAGVRRHAESVGRQIDWENPGSTPSPLASITQVPKAFAADLVEESLGVSLLESADPEQHKAISKLEIDDSATERGAGVHGEDFGTPCANQM
jgi:hypothetical protein